LLFSFDLRQFTNPPADDPTKELGFSRAIVKRPGPKYRGKRRLIDGDDDLDPVRIVALPCIGSGLDLQLQVSLPHRGNRDLPELGRCSLVPQSIADLCNQLFLGLADLLTAETEKTTLARRRRHLLGDR
jgi:hypothetical protein